MAFIAVNLHSTGNLDNFSIDPNIQIPLTAHAFEKLPIMSFTLSDEWGEDEYSLTDIVCENHLNDLFFGILYHLLSRQIAIGGTRTGKKKSKVVVNLRSCAYGRARILVRCLLFNTDDRAQTCNLVNIRTLHPSEKVAGIG